MKNEKKMETEAEEAEEAEEADWYIEKGQKIQAFNERINNLLDKAYENFDWQGFEHDERDDAELLYELFGDYIYMDYQPTWKLEKAMSMTDEELIDAIRTASNRAIAEKKTLSP